MDELADALCPSEAYIKLPYLFFGLSLSGAYLEYEVSQGKGIDKKL